MPAPPPLPFPLRVLSCLHKTIDHPANGICNLQPVLTVLVSELAVDWLKHAFITKFNHIRPSVYERYTDVLCRDLDVSSHSRSHSRSESEGEGRTHPHPHPYVDQSPAVARRLGFAVLPLAILAVLVGQQSVGMVVANASSSSSPSATIYGDGVGGWVDWVEWAGRVGPWIGLGIGAWFWCVLFFVDAVHLLGHLLLGGFGVRGLHSVP